jgi:magnesium transporter
VISIVTWDRDGGLREGVAPELLPVILQNPATFVWVDLLAPTREEAALLSTVFNFHPLALEDCETRRQHPKIDGYGSYVFLLTHGVHPESSVREFRTRQLSLFVGGSYLVSYHREKSRSVDSTLEAARKNPRLLEGGPGWVLYNILDQQVDQYLPVIENFEKKVEEIEERCLSATTSVVLQDVFALRKALMRLRRISGHQRDVLARLTRREFKEIDEKSVINMRDVLDHLVRVTDLADSYRELIAGALDAHLSIVSNRTNDIMRVLTVIATIFIPLTFIAGVYGMNFQHQPEYQWRYGYHFALLLMIGVAAAMYWYFRRAGVFVKSPPTPLTRSVRAGGHNAGAAAGRGGSRNPARATPAIEAARTGSADATRGGAPTEAAPPGS